MELSEYIIHGYPTWLVAPDFIQQYILPNFNVPPNLENRIKKFLEGEIKGENLQKFKEKLNKPPY